jgi:hypothetical protein
VDHPASSGVISDQGALFEQVAEVAGVRVGGHGSTIAVMRQGSADEFLESKVFRPTEFDDGRRIASLAGS